MTNDRLTKSELVDDIAKETGLTKVDVRKVIAELQESIIAAVANGQAVTLTRFMSFTPHVREEAPWTNPATGEKTTIDEKQIVKLSALAYFKDRVADRK